MTVKELIEMLQEYDEDMRVVIGMQQRYGSDWMMDIAEVDELEVNPFYGDNENRVVITEGGQIGTISYEEW